MNFEKPKKKSHLVIQNQDFFNKNDLKQYIKFGTLPWVCFINCNFLKVDLAGSDFTTCHLDMITFSKSNLDFISLENVKLQKTKEWVEIKDFSSFE